MLSNPSCRPRGNWLTFASFSPASVIPVSQQSFRVSTLSLYRSILPFNTLSPRTVNSLTAAGLPLQSANQTKAGARRQQKHNTTSLVKHTSCKQVCSANRQPRRLATIQLNSSARIFAPYMKCWGRQQRSAVVTDIDAPRLVMCCTSDEAATVVKTMVF